MVILPSSSVCSVLWITNDDGNDNSFLFGYHQSTYSELSSLRGKAYDYFYLLTFLKKMRPFKISHYFAKKKKNNSPKKKKIGIKYK